MPAAPKHRDNLISAALALFRRQGYAGTGLSEILAMSGAPKGSLYHYFPGGKEEIGAAAVAAAGAAVARTLEGLRESTGTAGEFTIDYASLVAARLEDSAFLDGCPISTTVLETVPRSDAIAEASQAAFDRWTEIVASVYERDGMSDADAERAAVATISAIEGALILARARRSTKPILTAARTLVEGPVT